MALLPAIPTLETSRLILRELKDSDAEAIYHCYRNEAVYKYSDWKADSAKSGLGFINYYRHSYQEDEAFRWAICFKDTDTLIGTIGYQYIFRKKRAELGYDLTQEHWNKGLISEALSRVIAFGFHELDFVRIEAWVHPANVVSRHLLLKFGFTEEGLLRQYAYIMYNGTWLDVYFYSRLKDEHQKLTSSRNVV